MAGVDEINCAFRIDVQTQGDDETATCEFVRRITGAGPEHCRVDRSACQICCECSPITPASLNPVTPTLIWNATESAFPDHDQRTIEGALRRWAQHVVESDGLEVLVQATHGCDAILVCCPGDSSEQVGNALHSIMDQDDVHVNVQLVADGDSTWEIVEEFESIPNVQIYRHRNAVGRWIRTHELVPSLRAPFVAVIVPGAVSQSDHLFLSIEQMERLGAEICVDPVVDPHGELIPSCPVPFEYNPDKIAWWSMVVRRASLVDINGFSTKRSDAPSELFYRSMRQRRNIAVKWTSKVSFDKTENLAKPKSFDTDQGHGFPQCRQACDVVLPFKDTLDQVRQSLEGLLAQTDADVVIHLVDDTSECDTDLFFAEYRHFDNIRFYRNQRNLGPFATFNNICQFAETDYLAVQDADDISLPYRMAKSCQLLCTSGSDLMGARTELFGDSELVEQMRHQTIPGNDRQPISIRASKYPGRFASGYYLENPTLVVRRSAFEALGGYADFGEGKRNRTGVDTEFQVRAHFSRKSIAVTNEILLRYRCHGNSATNHAESGLGSKANLESHAEVKRRLKRYAMGSFEPRWYGALGRHFGITNPV